ncbi:MAG: DUF1934 domain-containing protein [Candidatus Sericytochromatia bacterium]
MSKKPISITLNSRQEDEGLSHVTTETHAGSLYDKNDGRYLLFKNEDDGVSTSIRMDPDEIRLFRRGALESWQVFRLGEITGGVLTLGVNAMVLRVHTSHFQVEQADHGGRIELHYQLWTAADSDPASDPHELSLGRFELSLDWTVQAEG